MNLDYVVILNTKIKYLFLPLLSKKGRYFAQSDVVDCKIIPIFTAVNLLYYMLVSYSPYDLSLPLLYADCSRVETWWNYQDVISPFYRLYLITKGRAKVYINQKGYDLLPGTLFLIPKFAFHSYECDEFMEHYYICFFDETTGGKGISNPMKMKLQVEATDVDYSLMQRFMRLNPDKSLPASDPKHYDNDRNIYTKGTDVSVSTFSMVVESSGILLQLFSRFITEDCLRVPEANSSYEKLDVVLQHINRNLNQRISITTLAERMCITSDHFSKIFKRVIGMPPCEYIQLKRIERAQTLLLTSHMSIVEVAEKVGIGNLSQFSRLFSKLVRCSPREYRLKQFNELKPGSPEVKDFLSGE